MVPEPPLLVEADAEDVDVAEDEVEIEGSLLMRSSRFLNCSRKGDAEKIGFDDASVSFIVFCVADPEGNVFFCV